MFDVIAYGGCGGGDVGAKLTQPSQIAEATGFVGLGGLLTGSCNKNRLGDMYRLADMPVAKLMPKLLRLPTLSNEKLALFADARLFSVQVFEPVTILNPTRAVPSE
jgi:hypothetical protein